MPYNHGMTVAAGDPGFFGALGKLAGGALRAIGGALPGPFGIPATIAGGLFAGQQAATLPTVFRPTPGVAGVLQRAVPGGATGFEGCPPGAACPRGEHLNKSDYFLKDGTFVPKGSRCVSNRSRNVLNPRALTRANSRQRGFLKKVDSTLKTMPTKAGVSKRRKQISGVK